MQQRFKSERHNVLLKKLTRLPYYSNYDKRMQSIGLKETYAYGMDKDLECKKEEVKCNNIIKQYKDV